MSDPLPKPKTITSQVAGFTHRASIDSRGVTPTVTFLDSAGIPVPHSIIPRKTPNAKAVRSSRLLPAQDANLAALANFPSDHVGETLLELYERAMRAYVESEYDVT
jgi:hypothetical protein